MRSRSYTVTKKTASLWSWLQLKSIECKRHSFQRKILDPSTKRTIIYSLYSSFTYQTKSIKHPLTPLREIYTHTKGIDETPVPYILLSSIRYCGTKSNLIRLFSIDYMLIPKGVSYNTMIYICVLGLYGI